MELDFLYLLQNLHNDLLNAIMVFITSLGDGGVIWLVAAVVMLFFKKTRRCGITIMAGMAVSFLLGNLLLKNVIARPRPCAVDSTVKLLIPYPGEYSFPSGHTLHGFTAATATRTRRSQRTTPRRCVGCVERRRERATSSGRRRNSAWAKFASAENSASNRASTKRGGFTARPSRRSTSWPSATKKRSTISTSRRFWPSRLKSC